MDTVCCKSLTAIKHSVLNNIEIMSAIKCIFDITVNKVDYFWQVRQL